MKKVLFVCTGNTCRSPMAEGLFNSSAEKAGLLFKAGSCGTAASEGDPPSINAVSALKKRGVGLQSHRSRRVCENLLKEADLIVCVSHRHLDFLSKEYPEYSIKMTAFKQDIPDPYGGSSRDYDTVSDLIGEAINALIKDLRDGN